ncbi:TIGR02530 family flagellar biosynthesis protein [Isachenkonia alkalipeptolytica]|uniref:Flagellar protein n=1 Tax=Isachenkonia alkalipeptolytica TaxID=2565777 RepID=A0AA44BDY3_9CLOT|nr:TIGR02530 family flagellar biosynthesis protein [Isachenkonia alkalipeptolytica]NBG87570.1 flagellar protein [Isachenkonia alkalipeptolytica]
MNHFNINNKVQPVQPRKNQKLNNPGSKGNLQGQSFQGVLEKTLDQEVKFSKHANKRIHQRDVNVSPKDLKRIESGIDRASQKGIKETLILMDNRAFIASVDNRTIITASAKDELKEAVFTNIDGAVIV